MNHPNNYKPISLLSVFAKIDEKVLKFGISSYLESFNILNKFQYGFRNQSSTTLALTDFIYTIEMNRNRSKHSVAIFLDLKKAFDTVNHNILLSKLEQYGLRGPMSCLLAPYLSDRQQYTVINSISSPMRTVSCGVPQGSVLGPLLFLLYINDFGLYCEAEFRLFADD